MFLDITMPQVPVCKMQGLEQTDSVRLLVLTALTLGENQGQGVWALACAQPKGESTTIIPHPLWGPPEWPGCSETTPWPQARESVPMTCGVAVL